MKKLIACILALVLCGSLIACSASKSTTTSAAASSGSAAAAVSTGSAASAAASSTASSASSGEKIRFAVVGPLTGDQSEQGNNEVRGAQMAVDEINGAGGVNGKQLELVAYDDQGTPNQAVTIAEKIASDDTIEFVLANLNSGCVVAAQPTYINAGLAVLGGTNSMDELSTESWTNYFRLCLSDGVSCKVLMDVIKQDTDFKKPGIFYANSANDLSCANVYKNYLEQKYGFTDIPMETFNPDTDKDFSSQIEKFKASGVDAIFISAEYTPSGLLCMQCHEKGYYPVFGAASANNSAIFDLAGENLNDCMYTLCGFFNDGTGALQTFCDKYNKLYNLDANDVVTRNYDAVYIAADAYSNGATKDTLADYFSSKTDFTSELGSEYVWDGHIDNQMGDVYILKIVDGAYTQCARGVYPK